MKFNMPLQMQAYESMKAMIDEGVFARGVIYSETKTSRELGISRTPMRDAIQMLSQEGYLDVIPSKGFRLHEMTQRDLEETCQIRSALEGYCIIQMAKEHESDQARETLRLLRDHLDAQRHVIETTRSIEEFAKYDQAFHEAIVGYLRNEAFSDVFSRFHYRMRTQTLASLALEGRLEETLREHQEIVAQVESGNALKSYNAALTHLAQAKTIIQADKQADRQADKPQ